MSRNRIIRIPRGAGPIPEGEIVHLKYTTPFTITSTGGAQTFHVFKINSLYDPDLTLTGHQPYGRDQLAGLFQLYQVYKCKWRLQCVNTSSTATGTSETAGVVVVVPSHSAALTTTPGYPANLEMPRAVVKLLNNNDDAGRAMMFTGGIHIAHLFSIPKGQFWDNPGDFAAAMAGEPTTLAYLHVGVSNANANTMTTQWLVQLEMSAKVFDPIEFQTS